MPLRISNDLAVRTVLMLIGVFIPAGSHAQAKFEVASIKLTDRSHGELNLILMPLNDTLVTIRGMTLKELIQFAYKTGSGALSPRLVSGGAAWYERDEYDITARSEGHRIPSPSERKQMLRALLEERFQLKLHRSPRMSAVFALVVAKGGSRMKESTAEANVPPGFYNCGPTCRSGRRIPMEMLAGTLQTILEFLPRNELDDLNLPVVDKTSLTGQFDITLQWSARSGDGPDIFTAVEEQLGLKLQRAKAEVEAIIVDQVQRPAEN
jgi:uncharacterized protein (TIGR03435 family)